MTVPTIVVGKGKNGISIQEKVEDAIYLVTGEKVKLIASGRTDRGVHAQGQVANFITSSKIPLIDLNML